MHRKQRGLGIVSILVHKTTRKQQGSGAGEVMGGGPLWAQGQRLRELIDVQFSEATLILREPPALGPT